jgi:uncharacterized delta-60 repeat protein
MHVFQGSNRQKNHSYIPRRFGLALAIILTTLLCQISLLAQSAGTFRFSSQDYEVGGLENRVRVETSRSVPGAQITVVREGGAMGRVLVDYYSTNASWTNLAAVSGTLVFDDYQMSSSFIYPVVPQVFDLTDTNSPPPTANTVQFVLTNVRPDLGEDPTKIVPTLNQNSSTTLSIQPNQPGNGFNFERRKWRISEQGISYDPTNRTGIARIYVSYSMPYPAQGASVSYRINWLPPENENNLFDLEPGSDYASPDTEDFHTADYIPVTGTLTWNPGDGPYKSIDIPIINDDEVEFNEDFEVELFDPQPNSGENFAYLGPIWRATVTIMSDDQFGYIFNDGTDLSWLGYYGGEQPAGAVDRTWNPDFFQHTDPPYNSTPGANNTVHAIVAQPDGKTIIGGDFTAVNTRNRNRIARMNNDGSLDRSFNPGTGADGSVNSVVLQPDGRVIIGGGFTSFNGTQRYGIARLQQNGLLDTSFNPGLGANGVIRAMALQNDGKLLIGGDFTMINGTNMNYVARLNSNGTLDTSFNPGVGPNGPVNSLAVYSGPLFIDRTASGGPAEDRFMVDTGSKKGSLTIDYDFLNIPDTLRVYYEGVPIYDSGLVNGTNSVTIPYSGNSSVLEIVMNEGSGFFGTVWLYSLRIDPDVDPRPVIGGSFTEVAGQSRRSVARLNLDGTLDTTFNPGTGADNAVYAVAKQGNKVLMGGGFNSVDERSRNSIARLNEDGSLDTSFDPGLGANDDVYSIKVQEDGKAMIGGLFTSYNSTRRMGLARLDFTGKLDTSFLDTAYNQFAGLPKVYDFEPENFVRAIDFYKVTNYYLTNITILVTNAADTNLVATNILDMVPAVFDRVLIGGKFQRVGGGFTGDNQHNNAAFGLVDDRQPKNYLNNGRADVRFRSNVAALIGGATPGPGNIELTTPEYATDEDSGETFITLQRRDGQLGDVFATFATPDQPPGPGVAQASSDYDSTTTVPQWTTVWPVTRMVSDASTGPNTATYFANNGALLRFTSFEEDVYVPIIDDLNVEGDESIALKLTDPVGEVLLGGEIIPLGTALGRADAKLLIRDNDFAYGTLGFAVTNYTVNENEGVALITVTRVGGSVSPVSIDYTISDGSAKANQDYTPIRGTLTFAAGQTTNSFTIPIRNDNDAELEETINLVLFNPAGFPGTVPVEQRLDPARATATLVIIDDDFAPGRISFTAPQFDVNEDSPYANVTIQRIGGNLGDVFIDFVTQDGTAKAGQDYVSTNGTLHWADKDSSSRTIRVPILNNSTVDSDKLFTILLQNPVVKGVSDTNAFGFQSTTTVRIVNDDFVGGFAFSQPQYYVDENGGNIIITILRQGGIAGTNQVTYYTTNLTATAPADYTSVSNTAVFLPGETSKTFIVPIIDNTTVEGGKTISLVLTNAFPGTIITTNAVINIVDNEQLRIPAGELDTTFGNFRGANEFIYSLALQPDGRIIAGGDFTYVNDVLRNRIARINPDGTIDISFDPVGGANNSVRSITLQKDGRMVLGGLFTEINGTNRNYITRLNVDAAVDPTFNPGSGLDNPVYATLVQPDGRILIAGDFSSYNGVPSPALVRVITNGVIDLTFNMGTGPNGKVFALAMQADGKILIGGDFTTYNGIPRNRIARLNRDGSLDNTFDTSVGANGSIRSLLVQPDGKILVGGMFATISGGDRNSIARLNTDGTLDTTFNPGTGANGPINVIALQADGKIVAGGDFTEFNGIFRGRITRLDPDGSQDPTINFGAGFNASVASVVIQPDRSILVAGGFTEYNGLKALRLARIHGGSLAGPGSVEFNTSSFRVNESGTNAVLTVRRVGGTTGQITVQVVTSGGSATPGVDYIDLTNTVTFKQAETQKTLNIPVLDDTELEGDETVNLKLVNVTGGANLGPQPTAVLVIESDDSSIGFSAAEYAITENFVTGSASITVTRNGYTGSAASVTLSTKDITATSGQDYTATSTEINFAPGVTSRTIAIPILDDTLVEGTEQFSVSLSGVVGKAALGLSNAVVTILDNDFSAGQLSFTSAKFSGTEGSGRIVVTVKRTAGTTGVVSVDYATSRSGAANAATPGLDYVTSQGIVSFSDGETTKSFVITVIDDQLVEGNEDIVVTISNPKGGATILGATEAIATIVDDDLGPGSLDLNFNIGTGANGPVRVVKLKEDGDILLGGAFTDFNGANRSHIAELLSDGTINTNFNPGAGPNNTVADIEFDADGKLLISGNFNTVSGILNNRVARLDSAGNWDPTFNLPLGLNAEVSDIVRQPDGKVVIGGMFDIASAAGRNRIARLNSDGTVDISFDPGSGADAAVNAVALQDGKILVGGAFTTINGSPRRGLARLNANGTVDNTFQTGFGANGAVQDILLLENGKILIVGDFTQYNGQEAGRVARLNADGTLDTTFHSGSGAVALAGAGPNAVVYAVAQQGDGKFIIGGDFTSVTSTNGALARVRVARLNADGSLDASFNAGDGPNDAVYTIAVQPEDGRIIVGGKFTQVDRVPRGGIARFNNDKTFITPLPIGISGVSKENAGSTIAFTAATQAGFTYAVEASSDFKNWTTVQTISATSSETQIAQDIAAEYQFFRIRRVSP